jgi:peptide/nickel transport system permease protein
MAVFAAAVAPFEPNRQSLIDNLAPPSLTPLHPTEAPHFAGTDRLGRDVLSRVIHGARVSMTIAVSTSLLALTLGVTTGLVAGYLGGFLGQILMRVADIQLAFPFMVLAIVVVVALGPGASAVAVTLALWGWVPLARVTRAEVLVLRETEFITAAVSAGASPARVMFRHVLPNASSSILVTATFFVGVVLLSEGALSFIGLGVQPPEPSWGQMIADGRAMLTTAPWVSIAPGIPLSLSVLAVNVLGDALDDALDPRSRVR